MTSQSILVICRILTVLQAYRYTSKLQMIYVLWVSQSCMTRSQIKLLKVTKMFYCPFFALIYIFMYFININGYVKEWSKEKIG